MTTTGSWEQNSRVKNDPFFLTLPTVLKQIQVRLSTIEEITIQEITIETTRPALTGPCRNVLAIRTDGKTGKKRVNA